MISRVSRIVFWLINVCLIRHTHKHTHAQSTGKGCEVKCDYATRNQDEFHREKHDSSGEFRRGGND